MRKLIQRNSRGTTTRRRRGAALVELAIVMPILCLLTLGLMEYGWVFMKISQINQAARHGVRTAVRPDSTVEEVKTAVAGMMTQAGIKSYTLSYSDINVGVGEPVSVKITVNYDKVTLTGTALVPLPSTIHGRGTMAKEAPPR